MSIDGWLHGEVIAKTVPSTTRRRLQWIFCKNHAFEETSPFGVELVEAQQKHNH